MSLQANLNTVLTHIGTKLNLLNTRIGDLSTLSTTQKASVVAAMNELKGLIDNVDLSALIDDAASATGTTWSSSKIAAEIAAATAAILGGADTDDDTLGELAAQITALAQADNGLVSATATQSFTAGEQTQARSNIGAAAQSALDALTATVTNLTFTSDDIDSDSGMGNATITEDIDALDAEDAQIRTDYGDHTVDLVAHINTTLNF